MENSKTDMSLAIPMSRKGSSLASSWTEMGAIQIGQKIRGVQQGTSSTARRMKSDISNLEMALAVMRLGCWAKGGE